MRARRQHLLGVCIGAVWLLAPATVPAAAQDPSLRRISQRSPYHTVWEHDAPREYRSLQPQAALAPPVGDTIWLDPLPPECLAVPGGCQPEVGYVPETDILEAEILEDTPVENEWRIGAPDGCPPQDFAAADAWWWTTPEGWLRDLSFFGGVHGFKGPFDQGRNGNFGFHEGFNFGAPLGFWDWGWQFGAQAVHSNFLGDRTFDEHASVRNQFFFTGGIFRRARTWGCQWGLTYDWLHDEYYTKTDLKQIRSDTSFVFPGGKRELGYFGAYGMGGTDFVLISREWKYFVFMETTDIFCFYYRRHFEGGGDGRFWIGWSGNGDGVLGGEIRVPMGKNWALENRINYLIPKHGHAGGGAIQESWGVTLQLVWYPGALARCVGHHPYRPVLNVADNTLFMTDTFVPPPRAM